MWTRVLALSLGCCLGGCGDARAPEYIRLAGIAPRLADAPSATVLVSFWATWCPPCRTETAALLGLARDAPRDLHVVVVSHDTDIATVEQFLGGPPDPVLHFRLDADRSVAEAFGVTVLPTSILVVGGRLVARFDGPRDWDSAPARALLDRLIAEAH